MKRKLFFVLVCFLTANFSFATPPLNLSATNNDVAESLAADKDFQEYNLESYYFLEKVKNSKTAELFKKVVERKASVEEKEVFAQKLGYANYDACKAALVATNAKKISFQTKFETYLKQNNSKEIVRKAVEVVLAQAKIKLTDKDCVALWLTFGAACTTYCYWNYYEDCYLDCTLAAMSELSLCWLLAD